MDLPNPLTKIQQLAEDYKIIPRILFAGYFILDTIEATARYGKKKIRKNSNYNSILFKRFNL